MTQIPFNIPSQNVVKTTAEWLTDTTVYSDKLILWVSDEFYTTNQMKFKKANGVNTFAELDFMPIGSGSGGGNEPLLPSVGDVQFDKSGGRLYGSWDTPFTGDVNCDISSAILGGTSIVVWSGATTPLLNNATTIYVFTNAITEDGVYLLNMILIDGQIIINPVKVQANTIVGELLIMNSQPNVVENPIGTFSFSNTTSWGNTISTTTMLDADFEIVIDVSNPNTEGMMVGTDDVQNLKYTFWDFYLAIYLNTTRRNGSLADTQVPTTLLYNSGDTIKIKRVATAVFAYYNDTLIHSYGNAVAGSKYFNIAGLNGTVVTNPVKFL
jgi:hypothetical protein